MDWAGDGLRVGLGWTFGFGGLVLEIIKARVCMVIANYKDQSCKFRKSRD